MSNNTINKEEVEKFNKIAEEWWNPDGKFKPLHKFNPIRIEYIKNNIIKDFNISSNHKPLKGISILDIGCGGGLLSEPLARLGADVVGIDASKKNLIKAKRDFPLANIGRDYKQSLNKLNVSLIVISTPTKTHFQIAKYALEKKINVLVEKPISLSIKEVKILESLAKKNKVLLFVDYPFLFSGSISIKSSLGRTS